jgi:hypothetical protein
MKDALTARQKPSAHPEMAGMLRDVFPRAGLGSRESPK